MKNQNIHKVNAFLLKRHLNDFIDELKGNVFEYRTNITKKKENEYLNIAIKLLEAEKTK